MSERGTYPFKVKPYAHQLACWEQSKDREEYAIFAEMGCLDGESEIQLNWFGNSTKVSLAQLFERGIEPRKRVDVIGAKTRSFNGEFFRLNQILGIKESGVREMVELSMNSGKILRLTPDHEVLTTAGWTRSDELTPRYEILTNATREEWRAQKLEEVVFSDAPPCSLCGNSKSTTSPRSRYFGWCRSCIMKYVSKNSDGRTIDKDGYIRIGGNHGHPRANASGQMLEHLVVMEKKLGRRLEPDERVHHKDRNPKNNDPRNLELTTKYEHDRKHEWYRNLRQDVFVPVVDTLKKLRGVGKKKSFDLIMAAPDHNFISNGIVVHNCGKSAIAINTIAWQYDKGKIDGALIIAPKGCYADWTDEHLPGFMPSHVKYETALWNPAPRQREIKTLEAICKSSENLQVLVMNVEAFSSKKGLAFAEKFLCAHRAMIVLDESTSIKHLESSRTKNILKLRKMSTSRRIMSGDPTANSPLDIYAQMAFLDPHLLGFGSYYTFRSHYANLVKLNLGGRTFTKIVGFKDLEELHSSIKPFSFICKKADCLDLPPKVYQVRKLELGPKQRKVYDEMKQTSMAVLEKQIAEREERQMSSQAEQKALFEEYLDDRSKGCPTCGERRNVLCDDEFHDKKPPLILTTPDNPMVSTADLVIVQLQKLHQITCGFLKTDDGVEHDFDEPNPKLEALMEVLEELPKCVIWANYRHSIFQIEAELNKRFGEESVVTYFGDTTMDERREAKKEFRDMSSSVRFFLSNSSTGKFGLTLVEASTAVYFSNSYDREQRAQSEDRIHRIGQVEKVNIVDLVAERTVDSKILNVLHNKQRLSEQITRSNWKEWLE